MLRRTILIGVPVLALVVAGCVSTRYWPLGDAPPGASADSSCAGPSGTCEVPGADAAVSLSSTESTAMQSSPTIRPVTGSAPVAATPSGRVETATFALG